MQISPVQGVQVLLSAAHAGPFPLKQHEEFDTIARFLVSHLPQPVPAPSPVTSAPVEPHPEPTP